MNGLGGCPLAEDELLGNLSTQNMLTWLNEKSIPNNLDISRVGLNMF
jgi:hydroxymethylglutaryl-CoA lyase